MKTKSNFIAENSQSKITFKIRIFNTLNYLIEFNSIGTIIYTFLLILETLQFLYFTFAYSQTGDDLFPILAEIFKVTFYIPLFRDYVGDTAFSVIWIVHFCALTLFSILIYVVGIIYTDTTQKFSIVAKFIFKILGAFLILHKLFFALPSLYSFFIPIFCDSYGKCWKGEGIVYGVFSIFGILLNIHIAVFAELFRDGYIKSPLPWARPDSKAGIIKIPLKFLLAAYLAIGLNNSFAIYIHPVLTLFFFVLSVAELCGYQHYDYTIKIFESVRAVFIFFCFLIIYIAYLSSSRMDLDTGLIVILASFFLGVILYKIQRLRTYSTVEVDLLSINDEVIAMNGIIELASIVENCQKDSESLWLLYGIFSLHRDVCKKPHCRCEKIEAQLREIQLNGGEIVEKNMNFNKPVARRSSILESINNSSFHYTNINYRSLDLNPESLKMWRSFVDVLLENMVEKNSKSVTARLILSYFQEYMEQNYYKSYFNLVKANEKECTYYQQLTIHRMKSLLDQRMSEGENKHIGKDIDIDMNVFLRFEEERHSLDITMNECTNKVMQFWGLLLSTHLKIDRMYSLGGQISSLMKNAHNSFNELIKIFPDHIKTYISYSEFLRDAVNSEVESDEYQDKAVQIKRNLDLGNRQAYSDDGTFSINKETGIVMISGNFETLGLIINVNEYVQDIFGYSFSEVVGLSVNVFMPKAIATVHDKYLSDFMERGTAHILNKEIFVLGQHKNGLLIPLSASTRALPGLSSGLRYVGFFRRDMSHIKKTFINFPYKYGRSSKIGFIMTTTKGKILGMTWLAARMFGIKKDYFERKKGLFNNSLNIQKLNPNLKSTNNNDAVYMKGSVLTLNIQPIYDMLDKDFLSDEEVADLEKHQTNIEVFLQLTKMEHSLGIKYFVYSFVPVTLAMGQMTSEKIDQQENALEDSLEKIENYMDNASSSASSSIGTTDKVRVLVKELKKNMFEQHESWNIIILKRIIYVAMLMLLVGTIIDFVYYQIMLNKMQYIIKLNRSAHYQRNLMSTALYEFQSFINVALGTEQYSSKYEENRENSIRKQLLITLERLKNNAYTFQDYFKKIPYESINSITVDPGITLTEIFMNGSLSKEKQGLTGAIVQISSVSSRLVTEIPLNSLNTTFLSTFYNKKRLNPDPLTQPEKDAFYMIYNCLYSTLNSSTIIIENIKSLMDTTIDSQTSFNTILSMIRDGICILMIIVCIPFIQKIQTSKREVLKLFAEVPRKKISELLKNCENFVAHQNNGLTSEKNNQEEKPEPGYSITRLRKHSQMATTKLTEIENKTQETSPKRLKIAQNKEESSPRNAETDELPGSRIDIEAFEERRFKEERKQQFLNYNVNIGINILILIVCVMAVGGYQVGMYFAQSKENTILEMNHDYVYYIQSRWYNLASMFIYLSATTPDNEMIDPKTQKSLFKMNLANTLQIEDKINEIVSHYPENQAPISSILISLVKSDYCTYLFNSNILNSTDVSLIWCKNINNNLLEHGMKNAIFSILSDLKIAHTNLTINYYFGNLINSDAVFYNKLIFEQILIPTFEYLIILANDYSIDFLFDTIAVYSIHFAAIIFVIFIALIVLQIFFVGTLNKELWDAKGIVTLLPFDTIMANSDIKKMFSQQMNVII